MITNDTRTPLQEANVAIASRWSELLQRTRIESSVGRMLVLLVLAFVIFTALKPAVFLSGTNLQNIALSSPEVGVIAIAMTLAMLTGGIDLSVVSVANLTAITVSTAYTALGPQGESMLPVLVLLGLLIGVLGGAVNGLLISKVGITPILATLGTMQIYNGLAITWTGGKTLNGSPSGLTALGATTASGIPVLFLALLAVAAIMGILLTRTPLGLRIQLLGSNPVAAKYSGVRPARVLMSTYLLTGALGGIAGLLFIARNPTASADYGASYVLLVIVVAVLGGTNPNGGFATVWGVVLATLTLQVVSSGFTAIRLSSYAYAIAQGVILIAVMVAGNSKFNVGRRLRRRASVLSAQKEPMK